MAVPPALLQVHLAEAGDVRRLDVESTAADVYAVRVGLPGGVLDAQQTFTDRDPILAPGILTLTALLAVKAVTTRQHVELHQGAHPIARMVHEQDRQRHSSSPRKVLVGEGLAGKTPSRE